MQCFINENRNGQSYSKLLLGERSDGVKWMKKICYMEEDFFYFLSLIKAALVNLPIYYLSLFEIQVSDRN